MISSAATMPVPLSSVFLVAFAVLLTATLTEQHNVKFSYNGDSGPDKWGSLSPSFSACSNGKAQSPIDIVKKEAVYNSNLQPLTREYGIANGTLINNGFNIGLLYGMGAGSAVINGKNYTLRQVHWHSPSEHTIDGERFPVELHLVHTSDDGAVSVVAILYEYGGSDPFVKQMKNYLDELNKETCGGDQEAHVAVGKLKTKHLRRKTKKYFSYVGSLTVPPCSENVQWNILGKVRKISKEQVEMLKAPLDGTCKNNSRPTQPLNGRKVELYDENHNSQ